MKPDCFGGAKKAANNRAKAYISNWRQGLIEQELELERRL